MAYTVYIDPGDGVMSPRNTVATPAEAAEGVLLLLDSGYDRVEVVKQ